MKILLISHEYPPRLGGAGIVAKSIHHFFESRASSDIDLIYTRKLFGSGLWSRLWFLNYVVLFLCKSFRKYDLIILNDPAVQFAAGVVLRKKTLSKCVSIIHGPEKYISEDAPCIFKALRFKRFFFRAINLSQKKIYVSKNLKKSCETESNLYLEDNSSVIHNGVQDKLYSIRDEKVKYVVRKKNTIITVCRIEKTKGLENVARLIKELNSSNSNFNWTIIGEGTYRSELEKYIEELGISIFVDFIGASSREVVIQSLLSNEYFAHLPNWDEPFGLTLLEASMCGCKIITNTKGGIPEVLQYIPNTKFIFNDDYSSLKGKIDADLTGNHLENIRCQSDFCNELLLECK